MLNKISYLQEERPDRGPRQVSDRLGKTSNPMLAIFSLSFWKTWHILSWIYLNFLRSEKLSTTKFWWLKDFVIISTVMSIFRNKNYNSEGGKSWQRILKTSGSHIAGKVDMIYQTSNSATEWLNISSEIVSHQWVLVCGCSGQVKLVFHCPGFKGVNPPIDYLH